MGSRSKKKRINCNTVARIVHQANSCHTVGGKGNTKVIHKTMDVLQHETRKIYQFHSYSNKFTKTNLSPFVQTPDFQIRGAEDNSKIIFFISQ